MAIKDLLVAYDGTDAADAALAFGAALAGKHGAKLTGLLAHGAAENYIGNARWIGAEARKVIDAANSAALDDARTRFAGAAKEAGVADASLLDETGRPDLIVAEFAKFHDLTLIGRFSGDATDARLILHPDRIALKSGRPLLVVPENAGPKEEGLRKALFAWDGGRSAARALSDALHILEPGTAITLVTVGEGESEAPAPGRDIAVHLANHGMKAELVKLLGAENIGASLVDYAESQDPDLMIMGAYEHSKFREDFFGGVTDTVLRRTKVPVLVAH